MIHEFTKQIWPLLDCVIQYNHVYAPADCWYCQIWLPVVVIGGPMSGRHLPWAWKYCPLRVKEKNEMQVLSVSESTNTSRAVQTPYWLSWMWHWHLHHLWGFTGPLCGCTTASLQLVVCSQTTKSEKTGELSGGHRAFVELFMLLSHAVPHPLACNEVIPIVWAMHMGGVCQC